jgi:hypothetical protein
MFNDRDLVVIGTALQKYVKFLQELGEVGIPTALQQSEIMSLRARVVEAAQRELAKASKKDSTSSEIK